MNLHLPVPSSNVAFTFFGIDVMWYGVCLTAGIVAGELLPARVVTALSVSLFGMFLAVIMPAAREDHVVRLCVLASFAASYAATHLIPLTMAWSSGTRIIVLTIVIAAVAALICPVSDEPEQGEDHAA